MDIREADRRALAALGPKCRVCGCRLVDDEERADGLCFDHALGDAIDAAKDAAKEGRFA